MQLRDGLRIRTFLLIRLAENQMRESKVRVEIKGISQLLDGRIVPASHVQAPAQTKIHADGERIEFASVVDFRDALLRAAHGHEIQRIALIGGGVAGVEFDGALEAGAGGDPVPIVVEAHGGQGFGLRRECRRVRGP